MIVSPGADALVFAHFHLGFRHPPFSFLKHLSRTYGMSAKNRFARLDAFTKTVEDARVRTTSGGFVTILSLVIILYLVWGEWADFRRIIVSPELVVDKGRNEKMEIHMNVSFPHMPCELLTLDVMDVSGEVQAGVMHGINKVRLSAESEGSRVLESKSLDLYVRVVARLLCIP